MDGHAKGRVEQVLGAHRGGCRLGVGILCFISYSGSDIEGQQGLQCRVVLWSVEVLWIVLDYRSWTCVSHLSRVIADGGDAVLDELERYGVLCNGEAREHHPVVYIIRSLWLVHNGRTYTLAHALLRVRR